MNKEQAKQEINKKLEEVEAEMKGRAEKHVADALTREMENKIEAVKREELATKLNWEYFKGYVAGLINKEPDNTTVNVSISVEFFNRFAVGILSNDSRKYSPGKPIHLDIEKKTVILSVVRSQSIWLTDKLETVAIEDYKSDEDVAERAKNITKSYLKENPLKETREDRVKGLDMGGGLE